MTRNRPTLLLTRPEASSRRFLEELRGALGIAWPAVISPLMRPRFHDARIPACESIVFTSETAVAAVTRLSADRSALAWCVGPRTEECARKAGFRTRRGRGTAEDLANDIISEHPVGTVFCPVAADQAFDVYDMLKNAGIDTVSICLYSQLPCPPTTEAQELLAGSVPVILPLFSSRSAALAAAAFAGRRAPIHVAAISEQVAEIARQLDPQGMRVAQTPDAPALISAIGCLLDTVESG